MPAEVAMTAAVILQPVLDGVRAAALQVLAQVDLMQAQLDTARVLADLAKQEAEAAALPPAPAPPAPAPLEVVRLPVAPIAAPPPAPPSAVGPRDIKPDNMPAPAPRPWWFKPADVQMESARSRDKLKGTISLPICF
jgi:hypothetical protein